MNIAIFILLKCSPYRLLSINILLFNSTRKTKNVFQLIQQKKKFLKAKATLFNAFGPDIIPLSVIPFHTLLSSTIYVYNTPTTYRFNNSFSVNIQIHIFHRLESSHGIQNFESSFCSFILC